MKKWLFVLLISANGYGQIDFDAYFLPKTLRFDYAHSGNAQNEYIVKEKIIKEPLWGGTRKNLLDIFDFGNHRFIVSDSASGTPIYSRGFSSLFAEWRHSEEAKEHCGNFFESVVMPFPKKTIKLTFSTRNKENEWEHIQSFYINPLHDIEAHKNEHLYETVRIHYSGAPSQKLDIAFIAEGYTADESDKFIADSKKLVQVLLSTEPFKSKQDKINVWGVHAVSEESGVSNPALYIEVKTALGASFNTFDMERYLMVLDHYALRDAASNAPYDHIFVLVNTDTYGGGGIYNFLSIGAAGHALSAYLFKHEFGHALGGLADEYVSNDPIFSNFHNKKTEPWEPNITTLVNFENKWQHKISKGTPIPTPENKSGDIIGAFEGAGYAALGIYRPMQNCIMRSTTGRKFCSICEDVLEKKIDFYAQ